MPMTGPEECLPPGSRTSGRVLRSMLKEFDAPLQKGSNPGAWTHVRLDERLE